MLIFFFSGAALPLAEMPGWAQAVGRPLFMTHATEALRTTMLDGAALPWRGTGGLAWTTGTAAGWFAAGLAVFWACERTARRRGSLSRF